MTRCKNSRRRYRLLIAALVMWMFTLGGCEQAGTSSQRQRNHGEAGDSKVVAEEPREVVQDTPLLLEDEPLLLLDDAPTTRAPDSPMADNSRCFVCHVNYMQEKIAVAHARANIGCADCHGPSDAHIADESWASGGNGTAPDVMYPREEINPACMTCHPKDKIDSPQHEPVFASVAERKVCTDCHGNHRLPQRRCKWK